MKKLVAIGVLVLLIFGGYWAMGHKDEVKQMEDQTAAAATQAEANPEQAAADAAKAAKKAAIKVQIMACQQLIEKYQMWITACQNHSAPDHLEGAYDGFSYDNATDYKSAEQEQEQRLRDLQDRLTTVDHVN